MQQRQQIAFPNIAASLGGASRVEYSARFAWIHLPSQPEPVRVPRSKLPAVDKWTSFNLADLAKSAALIVCAAMLAACHPSPADPTAAALDIAEGAQL